MATKTIVVERPASLSQQAFLPALVEGLRVTSRHFFENVIGRKNTVTVQYPDELVHYPERYRGLHRLMKRDDGSVRCVACMCCSTACPANCITIVADETGASETEKRPAVFEIDESTYRWIAAWTARWSSGETEVVSTKAGVSGAVSPFRRR